MVSLKMASGVFRGDFFNLHAAGLRSHEDQLAGGAVEHDAEIELAIDGRGLFDQQPLHLLALRAGLVRHQLMPRMFLACSSASSRVLATLTPPPLPRPPA